MENWLFALVVLGVGVLLALLVDRMRLWPRRPRTRAGRENRLERNRWLTFWFAGRFPTREEEDEIGREADEDGTDGKNGSSDGSGDGRRDGEGGGR